MHVHTRNDTMIPLKRLQGQLLLRLNPLTPQLVDLHRKHLRRRLRAIDTVRLDTDKNTTTLLQEQMRVQSQDSRLIGLRHVGKHAVDHADEHAILERMARILDNGDDIGTLSRHADEVTARAMRELDSVDDAGGADDVGDVGDGGAGGGAEVEDLGAGLHVEVVEAAKDAGCKLGAEGVPDAVFGFGCCGWVCGGGAVEGWGGVFD